MKLLFDETILDLQNEMENMSKRHLNEFNEYAKSVGNATQELTSDCLDKQRDIDSRVCDIEKIRIVMSS